MVLTIGRFHFKRSKLFDHRSARRPPSMVFCAESAGHHRRVGIDERRCLFHRFAVKDENASQIGVITHRPGNEQFSLSRQFADIGHMAFLNFVELVFWDLVGLFSSVQQHHHIPTHRVRGVAIFHLKFPWFRCFWCCGLRQASHREYRAKAKPQCCLFDHRLQMLIALSLHFIKGLNQRQLPRNPVDNLVEDVGRNRFDPIVQCLDAVGKIGVVLTIGNDDHNR